MNAPVIWLTGPPAAGKSSIAARLVEALRGRRDVVWFDSDALREALTPRPTYDEAERDFLYATLGEAARRAAASGATVVISATAHRRRYRDALRARHQPFFEVLVTAPLATLARRDPKGLYAKARAGASSALPGVGTAYEEPLTPDLVVHSDREPVERAVERVVALVGEADSSLETSALGTNLATSL